MKKLLQRPAMMREAALGGRGHKWILEILIFILVFIVASSIESMLLAPPLSVWMFRSAFPVIQGIVQQGGSPLSSVGAMMQSLTALMNSMPEWLLILQLYVTVAVTVTVILFCRLIEKRKPATLGLRRGHIAREYLIGAAVGTGMLTFAVGINVLFGGLKISAGHFSVLPWVLYLLGFVLQGMSEEVLCRGYLMVSMARKNPLWVAVVGNSLVFAVLHLANPGISVLAFLNLFLCGCVFSVYVIKRGNLWGACAMHSLWNFVQGNVFGVSVSGMGKMTSIFSSYSVSGHGLLNGGAFGLEGGLAVTFVELAALALILFLVPAKKETAQAE